MCLNIPMSIIYKYTKTIINPVILTVALMITSIPTGAAEKEEIEKYASSATVSLQDVMNRQYDSVMEEIQDRAIKEGCDYVLTMETIKENGNPFKKMDYTGLISAYAAIKSYAENNKIKLQNNLSNVPYISYTISENTIKERKAVKINEYEADEDGIYHKSGYHYANEEEENPVYEDLGNGSYKITDRWETTIPEEEETKYYSVSFNVIKTEELFDYFGVKDEKVKELASLIRDKIEGKITNEELNQSVFLQFPETLREQGSWSETLKENIEYLEENDITDEGAVITAIASSLQGEVPYEWGGKAETDGYDQSWWTYNPLDGLQKGLDCSGFVQWAYLTAGYDSDTLEKLKSTYSMLSSDLTEVGREELRPGDIGIIERPTVNHCGIYAGDGEWYHCSSKDNTVVKSKYPFNRFFRPVKAEIHEVDFDKYTDYYNETDLNDNDIMLIAKLVSHEADNQGLNGWAAVAEVVKNRMNSGLFPDRASDVIFQKGQFTNAKAIASITPREEIVNTVRAVMNGKMSVLKNDNVLYFRNPQKCGAGTTSNWGRHQYYTAIGQHAFYIQ